MIDTDLHPDNIASDEDEEEDLSSSVSNNSGPIINLRTDILDAESLNILSENTYVDTVLTALPVSLL